MHNWFECKVTYEKVLENGMQKKVTEPYLVDALSFTEAEARIIEEIRPFISGEFTVTGIKRARLSELFFNENGDRFYRFKVFFITLDEKSGAEKKTAVQMLAQASTLKEAIAVLEEGMKGTMADYAIASVAETAIVDVFPYSAEKDRKATVTFDGLEKTIDRSMLDLDEFEIDFNGELKVQFKKENGGIVAVNAVDGGGYNRKDDVYGKYLGYVKHKPEKVN
jgi:hypothetical protein